MLQGSGSKRRAVRRKTRAAMTIQERIRAFHDEMTAIRRDIHRHPELAFEEKRTAALVAERLRGWGIEVAEGIARTGVVGSLRCGPAGERGDAARAIGLRADMDALAMEEMNDFAHRSVHDGRMHGCGHDGHTAMLLGAARYLAETRDFDGTVHFIFQPAEEGNGGGRAMIEDGLFERFPVAGVFGMHNMPRLPVGRIAARAGPVLAAADEFEITVTGTGGHAAMPHLCIDPVPVAGEIIGAVQSLVGRRTDPLESLVVSITRLRAGDATNVIPETATLAGSARAFSEAGREAIESGLERIAAGVAAAHGARAELRYARGYPPTINHAPETETAARAAAAVVGAENVVRDFPPLMASEDFSYMLNARPGCFVFIGNGGGEDAPMCHSPHYDFNDAVLPIGASYWAALVAEVLGGGAAEG